MESSVISPQIFWCQLHAETIRTLDWLPGSLLSQGSQW